MGQKQERNTANPDHAGQGLMEEDLQWKLSKFWPSVFRYKKWLGTKSV